MNYDQILERLKSSPILYVPVTELRTTTALQPREARLIPIRDKGRAEERSANHIATLRLILEGSQATELDPIVVAKIASTGITDHELYVVDGHHRLMAYKRGQRKSIPAHVMQMDFRTAVLVSKITNCSGRALEMHAEQRREASWQYLADVTYRGAKDLPEGETLRSVAARFGISKNTVSSMLSYLPRVDLKGFHMQAIDTGTSWPKWRYVRQPDKGWQKQLPSSQEAALDKEAERVARQVIKLVDSTSPAVRARALEKLANDEEQEEALTFFAQMIPSHIKLLGEDWVSQLGQELSPAN